MKLCLECADGGHLDEMMSLLDAFSNHEFFFVTFNTEMTRDLHKIANTFFVPNFKGRIDPARLPFFFRDLYTISYLLKTSFRSFTILYHEKPDFVISTGGPVTIPLFFFAKLLGIKTIYIESITRIRELSGTGKVVYLIADIFLVQWKSLVTKYKKVKYWGKVI